MFLTYDMVTKGAHLKAAIVQLAFTCALCGTCDAGSTPHRLSPWWTRLVWTFSSFIGLLIRLLLVLFKQYWMKAIAKGRRVLK